MATGQRDDGEIIRVRAPGVVQVLGAHVPSTGGPVLSAAIGRYIEISGIRGGDVVELRSDGFPGTVRVRLDVDDARSLEPEWGRPLAGVVAALHPGAGLVGSISSTLPAAVGLSSSAALAIAVALALGAAPDDVAALVRIVELAGQAAGGAATGPAAALTVAAGRRGHALLIDGPGAGVTAVTWPDDAEIVVVHTAQDRALAASTSVERAAECAAAEVVIGPLRAASPTDVDRITDPLVRRRARHVVSEGRRVRAAAEALRAGDVVGLGRLLGESHASARDDFEVSTPTADNIVSRLARTPGVLGARLTGAGFGGCVVAVARPGTRLAPGLDATVLQAVDGAGVVA